MSWLSIYHLYDHMLTSLLKLIWCITSRSETWRCVECVLLMWQLENSLKNWILECKCLNWALSSKELWFTISMWWDFIEWVTHKEYFYLLDMAANMYLLSWNAIFRSHVHMWIRLSCIWNVCFYKVYSILIKWLYITVKCFILFLQFFAHIFDIQKSVVVYCRWQDR